MFGVALRVNAEQHVRAIRDMLASECLPPPVNDHRCGEHSMREICMPELTAKVTALTELRSGLFDPDQ